MTLPRVSIQTEDFDVSTEIAALRHENKGVGAVCSFVGTVRDRTVVPTLGTSVSRCPPKGRLRLRAAGRRKTAMPWPPWNWSTTPA